MLTQSYAPIIGGIEHMVQDLSGELARRGHDVAVATLRQPGVEPVGSTMVPVHGLNSSVHSIPGIELDSERNHAPPAPDPRTTLDLRRLLREHRPDVIHAHDWLIHSFLPLERRSGAALCLSMHDYGLVCATKRFMYHGAVCSGPGTRKCLGCAAEVYASRAKGTVAALGAIWAQPRLRRRVDVFLPLSAAVRDLCEVGNEVHRVIPNFVSAQPPETDGDIDLAGLPAEPFILYFGEVSREKGVDTLLAAYRELPSPPPLVLVGRTFTDEIADTSGAIALGPKPHKFVLAAVRRALFTVAPSIVSDVFPMVSLETAAAGKPIIASRIGGLLDSVADEETGLLVPPGDVAALGEAIKRLLSDPGLRKRMGEAAAARRAALFSPEVVLPRYEEAYELALERRRSRPGAI
ncbi:MAG TPA: glycosyltransferase family 4 protein [Solirubrobacterales bacterium]|nr:glycosyltransferase family 4 protein [Solirubrobacterales bacterium]